MPLLRALLVLWVFAVGTSGAIAADGPYDESADAEAQIATALGQARQAGTPVMVVFGANWCGDCRLLDKAFKEGVTGGLIANRYQVVKVDVGRFDKHVDVAARYGVPLKRGIPAVAVLASDGRVLYATRAGELAHARRMGDQGLHDFFAGVVTAAK